jgi:hypothetical protein
MEFFWLEWFRRFRAARADGNGTLIQEGKNRTQGAKQDSERQKVQCQAQDGKICTDINHLGTEFQRR